MTMKMMMGTEWTARSLGLRQVDRTANSHCYDITICYYLMPKKKQERKEMVNEDVLYWAMVTSRPKPTNMTRYMTAERRK